jgi:hypothetical protein
MAVYYIILCDVCGCYNNFKNIIVDHGSFICSCGRRKDINECQLLQAKA